MNAERSDIKKVVIIGGGFSGAAVAYQLSQLAAEHIEAIIVIEPRQALGLGAAYGTSDPSHRINVPAARMTFLPKEDQHFQNWLLQNTSLDDDKDAVTDDGRIFSRRSLFGRYVSAQLAPLIDRGLVEHVQGTATLAEKNAAGFTVTLDSGRLIDADIVVLATTHPKPRAPARLSEVLRDHPKYVADPTARNALAGIEQNDRILIIGSGLTSADIIASLDAKGHFGKIDVISRRGLRSRGHPAIMQDAFGDFTTVPQQTARLLLRQVRRVLQEAAEQGIGWHAVFDQIRGNAAHIWASLPVIEKKRLVRHLRAYWDVHRFRIAPQIETILDRKVQDGSLRYSASSIQSVASGGYGCVAVTLKDRRKSALRQELYDAVIVATGPSHSDILTSQSLTRSLGEAGHLNLDGVGLGLDVDAGSRAINRAGQTCDRLYIAGPLARGRFGELMGLPQVTEHAYFVAAQIVDDWLTKSKASSEVMAAE